MRLSWFLLALLALPGCLADFMEIIPLVQSSGHLPQGYRVRMFFTALPGSPVPPVAFPLLVNVDFLGLTNANSGVAVDWGWVPFIKNLNGGALANSFTGWTLPAAFVPPISAYSWNAHSPPLVPLTIPNVGTSNTGRRLFWSFAAALTAAQLNVVWEWEIPLQYLASNPPYVEVHVGFSFTWATVNAAPFVVSPTSPVDVPWKTASTQLITSSLHLERFEPSSTLQSAQLTSLGVAFTPGKQLVGGAWLSVVIVVNVPIAPANPPANTMTYVGLFNAAPAAPAGQTLPVIPIGVGGCQATPSDIYCCSQSVASQPGGDNDRTRLRIQLLPQGCVLPAGKQVTFVIPQAFLGAYPALTAPAGAAPIGSLTPIRLVVNGWLESSSDPQSHHEARLGQTWMNTNGGVPNAAAAFDLDATSPQFGNYFASWIIGVASVSNFQAIPSTTTTGVVPQNLVLRWTLTTGIPDSTPAALALVVQVAARFVITANPGVFRPNIGTWDNQIFFPPVTGACARASYYTNEFGTLFITPNPLPVVGGCYTGGLTAGTVLTFTLPTSVLMPNPTPQLVLFDISGIPDQFTTAATAGATVYFWNGIDAATLKNAAGYTTTANCNTDAVPNFLFTSPNDIASLQIADRNRLVGAISSMSTGPAAIIQCLSGAVGGTVSWVKFPESTWRSSAWPLTNNAALGNWAQQVGVNPPVFVLNWGQMVSYPMYAILVTYPPQPASLQSLGITDSVPVSWRLAFIVRIDRLTLSGAVASLSNPWQFYVTTASPILAVKHIGTGNVVRAIASVSPIETLTGGQWAQRADSLLVVVPQSGVVFGYSGLNPSPIPDDGSDDALFGLLALIAVPVLLCCCLLALLWFLRPKAEACPCVPEYPVQEMYWVNAQPCAPTFSVAQCGPATTPVYLVQ